MFQQLRIAILMLVWLTIFTGGVYPLVVTLVAQMACPHQANGSVVRQGEQLRGSELIGQSFTQPQYFWGRLSATTPVPFNAAASSGSNFGPLHPQLKAAAEARIAALKQHPMPQQAIPVDLVTSSGSGLDPHVSPAAADFQIPRVAAARHLSEDTVRTLVRQHTAGRQFGLLGEPRVNILQLNLELDRLSRAE